MKKQLYRTQD